MESATVQQKPILVAVDGSDESAGALAWAVGRATGSGEALRIVTCYEQPYPATDVAGDYWRELMVAKRAARTRAESTVVDVLGQAEDVDHVVRLGSVDRVLVEMSPEASLIVVGHRAPRPWWSRLRGTLAVRIKESAACPVASIPVGEAPVDEPIAA